MLNRATVSKETSMSGTEKMQWIKEVIRDKVGVGEGILYSLISHDNDFLIFYSE